VSRVTKKLSVFLSFAAALCVTEALAQTCMPGASWCSGAYAYDAAGNIRAIGNDVYIYDTSGRLVSGTADVQRTGIQSRQDYTYDAFGNRIAVSRAPGSVDCPGGCGISVTIDSNTNHINSNGAQYDAAGNLIFIQDVIGSTTYNATYTYDTAGRLARAAANTDVRDFLYTADDERIATADGASWTWTVRGLDGKVLREFTSYQPPGLLPTENRQWAKDYVWRDGLLLASVTPTSSGGTSTQHFHLDHLGTPRLVTGANGVQLGIHAYYPFGAELNLGLNEQPNELMKFTGHERDVLAGDPHTLDDMYARYYGAGVGRFLSVDPELDLKAAIHNPQKWNRYAYVVNNPVLYHDPTGKQEAAGFAMDRDVQDLMSHRITEKEYWARLNARGVGALIGAAPWAGWWGVSAAMSWLGVGAVSTAGGSSVLLGETMRRIQPIADEMNAGTFNEAWSGDKAQMMARNITWLQDKIGSGARIFDLGRDALKQVPSDFYASETKLLQSNGYVQQFVKYVMVNGEAQQLFEWVKKPPVQ
jgi:RHS repeat-associated protein